MKQAIQLAEKEQKKAQKEKKNNNNDTENIQIESIAKPDVISKLSGDRIMHELIKILEEREPVEVYININISISILLCILIISNWIINVSPFLSSVSIGCIIWVY